MHNKEIEERIQSLPEEKKLMLMRLINAQKLWKSFVNPNMPIRNLMGLRDVGETNK